MSALLALLNNINNPVDHASKFTGPKAKKKQVRDQRKPGADPCRSKPFYSPIWEQKPPGRGVSKPPIKFKGGLRLKLCPNCDTWKQSDTKHFQVDIKAKLGMSSHCRECTKKNYKRIKHNS